MYSRQNLQVYNQTRHHEIVTKLVTKQYVKFHDIQSFTIQLITDLEIIATDHFAAELIAVPGLHQTTGDTPDLLCPAEHIWFRSDVTFLLQQ